MNIDEMIEQHKARVVAAALYKHETDELVKTIRTEAAKLSHLHPRYSLTSVTEDKYGIIQIRADLMNASEKANIDKYASWVYTNKDEWQDWRGSIGYLYHNGYIHNGSHGGWHFLKIVQTTSWDRIIEATSEEWEAIKTGMIPERMRPEWLVANEHPIVLQKK